MNSTEGKEAGVSSDGADILATMDRLRDMLWARDPAIIDEFVDAADTILVGSDAGETARGIVEIKALLTGLFALPIRLRWDWRERIVSQAGPVAWVFADAELTAVSDEGEIRKPYRLTGVLEHAGNRWRWRQYHGSEPAPETAG